MRTGRLALLICALLLSAQLSYAGYTLKLDVQVFDQDFRPVQGALVYADHQLNSVTGYVKTKPHPTNESGYYRLQFTDYEELESQTKYTYTLYVKYGDQLDKQELLANPNETRVITSRVNSYYAFVKVHDQKGKPLEADLTVSGSTIEDQEKRATAAGDAVFQLPPGSFTLKAERPEGVKSKDFTLSKDAALDFVFGRYNMDVLVTDDRKRPLVATVEVGTQSATTSEDGTAHFANITDEVPQVVIKYADRYKTFKPNLGLDEELSAIFDLTKPTISDLHASIAKNGGATITFFAQDEGTSATGVDTVTVSYEVAGVETLLPAYAVGYSTFEAKVPAQEPGTLVRYTVKIADKDGNAGMGKGSYTVPAGTSEPTPAPTPTPSPIPIPQVPATTGPVPTEMLVMLGIAALLVAGGIIYYFKRKREEGFGKMQPPAIPPAA